jgi:hypothetical protein
MTKTFTPDDLTRFLYDEMSETEKVEFCNQLLCDPELYENYQESKALKKRLDEIRLNAPAHVIESILNYSKNLNLHPSQE